MEMIEKISQITCKTENVFFFLPEKATANERAAAAAKVDKRR